jgi:hypothetical protein
MQLRRGGRAVHSIKSGYLPASGVAGPLIAVSDDDGLAFRTYNSHLGRYGGINGDFVLVDGW